MLSNWIGGSRLFSGGALVSVPYMGQTVPHHFHDAQKYHLSAGEAQYGRENSRFPATKRRVS